MWRPDGWGARTRIGVLTPQADVGPEAEIGAMVPQDVTVHAARVPFGAMAPGGGMDPTIALAPVRAFADPPHLDDAAERLAAAPLHAIGFGFTSSGYVIGAAGERAMIVRLERRTRGIPVVATCTAFLRALSALGAGRVALFDPPWFSSELSGLGRRFYEGAGLEVVHAAPCGLPGDQAAILPGDLHAWIVPRVPARAEAVVIGGNGFRAVGVVAALEEDLGLPVLAANQVLLWAALGAAGADTAGVAGYGRIFSLAAPARAPA